MSEENKTPVMLWELERNGISVPFYGVERKRDTKGKDGKPAGKKGEEYPSVNPQTNEEWTQLLAWLGDDWWKGRLQGILNQYFLNLYNENTAEDDSGFVDIEQFKKQATELSARGEKMSEIIKRIVELRNGLVNALEAEDYPKASNIAKEIKMLGDAYSKKKKTKEEKDEVEREGLDEKAVTG